MLTNQILKHIREHESDFAACGLDISDTTLYSIISFAIESSKRGSGTSAEGYGIEVEIMESPVDHVVIVQIDTPGLPENEDGPLIRVYLNDGDPLFENPPYPKTSL